MKESEDIMGYLKTLLKTIETSALFEEEVKEDEFAKRAREFDELAEESRDTSRITTEA